KNSTCGAANLLRSYSKLGAPGPDSRTWEELHLPRLCRLRVRTQKEAVILSEGRRGGRSRRTCISDVELSKHLSDTILGTNGPRNVLVIFSGVGCAASALHAVERSAVPSRRTRASE